MATNRIPFARTFAATALVATAITGLGATAAQANPSMPASATTISQTGDVQGAVIKNMRLTTVNNTDLAFTYRPDNGTATATLLPGQSFTSTAGDGEYHMLWTSGITAHVGAHNHVFGTPNAFAKVTVGNHHQEAKEHQGTDEFDRLVNVDGIEVTSYRHGDTDTKNFTLTISKEGAAKASVDNTKSSHNAYVNLDGQLYPVRKGAAAALPELARGVNKNLDIRTGNRQMGLDVTWQGNQAVFSSPGRGSVTIANGQSVTIGFTTITRADTNHGATTAYSLSFVG